MNKFLTGIIILLLFAGCKKADKVVILTGIYKPANTVALDQVVLYTKHGQTSDTASIKAFLKAQDSPLNASNSLLNNYSFNGTSKAVNIGDLYFNFTGSQNVVVTGIKYYWRSSNTKNATILSQNASQVLVQDSKADSIVLQPGSLSYSPINVVEYPELISHKVNATIGYQTYVFKQSYPFVIKGDELYMPLITYTTVKHDGNYHEAYSISQVINIPDKNIQAKLGEADTVVIQTGLVKMQKQ